jgi:hypothetical protein
VIDIHIRLSRRFVFWLVVVIVGWLVVSWLLTGLGHESGKIEIGPV